ncbi:MAG: hypothetical protein R2795_05570 [Saprospiraceae bacterium]
MTTAPTGILPDDVFYAWVDISGNNASFYGWTTDDIGYESYEENEAYGLERFGPYPVSGGDHLLTIRDALYDGCEAQILLPSPSPCSDGCTLEVTQGAVVCNDMGTQRPRVTIRTV